MAAAANRKAKHSKLDPVHINVGLQQVYPDPEEPSLSRDLTLDIVAIPGLGANPEWTWVRDKVHWLRDSTMLGRKIPNARISVFQYQSQWFGKGSVDQQLDNVVDQLLYQLKRTRGDDCKTPIIFVCHCLGGIVLEKTLLSARLRQGTFPSVFPYVAGCIFLGTPFNGTKTSEKARVLAGMAETFGMGVQTSLLKLLEKDSDTLKRMLDEFVKLITSAQIRVFCFFESQKSDLAALFVKGLPFKSQELIVDKDSATYPGVESLQLASDHFALNKYTGPKDGNYLSVANEIHATAKKAPLIIKSRQNALRQALISNRTYHAIIDDLGKGFSDIDSTVKGNYKGPVEKPSWVLGVEQYTNWREEKVSPFLWIHGKAGMGQGAIASSVIKDLNKEDSQNTIVASFFCDQGEESRRSLSRLLRMIIRQIITVNQDLAVHLLSDTHSTKKGGPKDFDAEAFNKVSVLWDALWAMTNELDPERIYVVIYGLEQLSKESLTEFFQLLEGLPIDARSSAGGQLDNPRIQWLFLNRSGRPEIEKNLSKRAGEINLSNEDNAIYVSSALRADISARVDELELSPSLGYFAKRYIHSRADDNFIYVSLVIQELKNAKISGKTSHAEVRTLLESFPYGLTDMFTHVRERVLKEDSEGLEYTKEILRCLIFAINAPTMRQLAVMADLPRDHRDDLEILKTYIVRCGSFLTLRGYELDEDNMTVEWLDISAQEHLQAHAKEALSLELKDVQHGIIALRCLEYVLEKTEAHSIQNSKDRQQGEQDDEENNQSQVDLDEERSAGDHRSETSETNLDNEDAKDDTEHDEDEDTDEDDAGFEHLAYLFENWIAHAKLAPIDVLEEFQPNHRFWEDESSLRESWWAECVELHPLDDLSNVSILHVGAITGFAAFVDYLLNNGWRHNVDHEDSRGFQPLYYACMNGDFEIVQMLLGAGADPNFVSITGDASALYPAASSGHKDIVECLLERSADIDSLSADFGTALYAAVEEGHIEVVKFLLERGAKVNLIGGWHKNALNIAAYTGSVESVQLLLEHNAEIDPDIDYMYGSALGAAARRGHADVAKLLISRGWSPNKSMETYGSFLTAAATYGHVGVVEALVQREARITVLEQALQAASQNGKAAVVRTILDRTPTLRHQKAFMLAADFGRDEVLQLLFPRGIQQEQLNTALYRAADHEHEDTVKLLLEFGADPNAEGAEYGTALTAAAYDGTYSILLALLEKGADARKRGGEYGTALQAAALFGDVDNVRLLIDHGAEVNTEPVGYYGNPLQAACYSGDEQTIRLLLEKGADINVYGGHFKYAIIAAIDESDSNTVQILLDNGANVNVRGGEDNMPVIVAAGSTLQSSDLESIIDHGADINARCDRGTTALIQCAFACDNDGIETLLSRKADISIISDKYGSALHAAASEGDKQCCETLLKAGAEVNAIGGPYATALQAAAFKGDLDTIQLLREAEGDINLTGGEYGTAVQAASFGGDVDIVTYLLDHDATIDWPGGNGKYGFPLQAAAAAGHRDILGLLLERGADVNAFGGLHGHALLAAASKRHNHECIQHLIDCGANSNIQGGLFGSVVQAAAYGNNLDCLDSVLDSGADINAVGGKYGNALQAASIKADLELVEYLLAHGASTSLKGGKYYTALQAAAYADKLDVVNKLLDHGADFRLKGGRYTNAITAAAIRGNKGVLDRFLSMGPPEQMLDEALVESCYYRQSGSVDSLLKSGANIYCRHPLLGLPIEALKIAQPDGYNSDDEDNTEQDDDEDDDEEEDEDEEETWEGDDHQALDGESQGSVTDLNLEDDITEEVKIEKLLNEAMARVKRNPSVKRFRTVRRKGVSPGLVGGPPPVPMPQHPSQASNQAQYGHSHGQQPAGNRQSFQAFPGPEQHPNPQGQSGYLPYRTSASGVLTPPGQHPPYTGLSRRPVPQRFNQSQPELHNPRNSSYSGQSPPVLTSPNQQDSLDRSSSMPGPSLTPMQHPQSQSGFGMQSAQNVQMGNQYYPPPQSTSQYTQSPYNPRPQSQYHTAQPPKQSNAQTHPPQQQHSHMSSMNVYGPYAGHSSQTSSQTSLQSSQYASSTPQNSTIYGAYPHGGTPNSSQTSGWSVDESRTPQKPAQANNRWHSSGYDGHGYN